MVERKGFIAKVAPPRPVEEEAPLVVGSEEAPAFPGLEFEWDGPFPSAEEIAESGEFMVGPTVTLVGVEPPEFRPTAVAHDEHADLPDHVREEILAGRKAMGQHEAKHVLEMSLGAKLSAQNHARTRPAPKLDVSMRSMPADMYDNPDLKFGRGNPTTITQKSNYNEGSEG